MGDDVNTKGLWAKSEPWQSLPGHMLTVGTVAKVLLAASSFHPVLTQLSQRLGTTEKNASFFAAYTAAMHDIGKCHPCFQQCGPLEGDEKLFLVYPAEASSPFRHERYSACIMKRVGKFTPKTNKMLSQILLLHHQGKTGWGSLNNQWKTASSWLALQDELADLIFETFTPPLLQIENTHRDAVCTALLGITILADWIASGEFFADLDIGEQQPDMFCNAVESRTTDFLLHNGLATVGLPDCTRFTNTWLQIPAATMRPLQKTIETFFAVPDVQPLAVLLEAPMGEGKTEAGVYAALKMAKMWGKDGLYIGLPTAATSNQMYSRINNLLTEHNLPGARLLHAMAWLVDDSSEESPIQTEDTEEAGEWTHSTRRGLLAPYAVGTIDQAMMAALLVKYGVLRLIGLESKVLILDEVHAYDTYMSSIIVKLLQWCKVLRVPVVMLSATLPVEKKKTLLSPYGETTELSNVYPALTVAYDDRPAQVLPIPNTYQHYAVKVKLLEMLGNATGIAETALERSRDGGCLCVLMNTVVEAQEVYQRLKAGTDEDCKLLLFHARFSAQRRAEIEAECIELFGKDKSRRPRRAILVATQVVEQSLDLDFDGLITAIAPIDLLLQRMGRLHRHRETVRPPALQKAVMEVLVPTQSGDTHPFGPTEYIYPPALLNRTRECLEQTVLIRVPEDIAPLVEQVYSSKTVSDEELQQWAEYAFESELARGQALSCELPTPQSRAFSLAEHDPMLDDRDNSSYLSAKTRLGEASVRLALVPHSVYEQVRTETYPSRELARNVLSYSTSVSEKRLRPFLNCTDVCGRPLLQGRGLLLGTWVGAEENNSCDFAKTGGLTMDPELGFQIRKGINQ